VIINFYTGHNICNQNLTHVNLLLYNHHIFGIFNYTPKHNKT